MNGPMYTKKWKNMVQPNNIRIMHFACCVPKVTDTHSEYVVSFALLRQLQLAKRADMLGYMYEYTACLVKHCFSSSNAIRSEIYDPCNP